MDSELSVDADGPSTISAGLVRDGWFVSVSLPWVFSAVSSAARKWFLAIEDGREFVRGETNSSSSKLSLDDSDMLAADEKETVLDPAAEIALRRKFCLRVDVVGCSVLPGIEPGNS